MKSENNNMTYSAVIPVFNEDRNVVELYKRLKKVLDGLNDAYEIIFIDDGSKDDSFKLLKDIALSDNSVKVLKFRMNYGQHKAVVAGMMEAQGRYVITMDSDLQNPPEEIPRLVSKIGEGFDMVSGYRKMRKDTLGRRLPSALVNMTIFAITGLKMNDYGSMLRIFKRDTARALAAEFKNSGGYITMLVAKVTRNVAEIEVDHEKRLSGQSKYNFSKLANLFYRILFCYNENIRRILGIKTEEPFFVIEKRIEDGRETVISA